MLTLGYITKLNKTDDNLFEVRIPIFEKAGSSKDLPDLSGSYFQATVNQVPGQYNAYQVGDCVVIGFLDNHYEKPIILGKLYLGNSQDKIEARGFLDSNALEVSDKAVLPGNTTIGEIDYKDLEKLLRAIETLGGQITTVADGGGGGGTEVIANPTMSGGEADLTGLQVGATKYKIEIPINVVANPTVTSSDPALSSIQIGEGKYRITSGSGTEVIPNPEPSGDEDILYRIQIDGAKFIVGGSPGSGNIGLTPYEIDSESGPVGPLGPTQYTSDSRIVLTEIEI